MEYKNIINIKIKDFQLNDDLIRLSNLYDIDWKTNNFKRYPS